MTGILANPTALPGDSIKAFNIFLFILSYFYFNIVNFYLFYFFKILTCAQVPHTDKLVVVQHTPNLAELRRLRKQFFKFVQMHPPPVQEIGSSFVEFLNINANG
jgi:hypothetical protein